MNWIIAFLLPSLLFARAPIRHNQITSTVRDLSSFQSPATIFSGTGGTSTADVNSPWTGAQSNKFTIGNASTVIFQQAFSAKNMCGDSVVQIAIRFPNKDNVLNLARIDLYVLNDFANYKSAEVWGSLNLRDSVYNYWGDWQTLNFPLRFLSTTGAFNCANVTSVALGLRAQATTQDTLTIGQISSYPYRLNKAALLFTVDDQYDNFRTNGGPILDSLCMDYTMFINPGGVGSFERSTRDQLDSMFFRSRCSRPEIAPHTMQHDSISDLSSDSLVRDIQACIKYIRDNKWCRNGQCCTDCFALPFGKKNRPSDSTLRASGLLSWSRTSKGSGTGGDGQQWDDPMNARALFATGNTADTTVYKALIDSLVLYKGVGSVIVHKIGPPGCTEDINTICKPSWDAIVRHAQTKVAAGTLDVMSVGDFLRSYGGGLGVSKRIGMGK